MENHITLRLAMILSILRLGMTRDKVRELLGEPDSVNRGSKKYLPSVWLYGEIEIWFEQAKNKKELNDGGLIAIFKSGKYLLHTKPSSDDKFAKCPGCDDCESISYNLKF